MQGTIFNIQRYTIHDGPGIRTEIFLKGCPMSCKWCGNPEGISAKIQAGFYPSKCLGMQRCGLCGGKRDNADVCPADAVRQWGRIMDVEEVMEIIRKDCRYYESSGGGVTLSGGEPLMQADFTTALLQQCRKAGIHTCLESTFHVDWNIVEQVIPYTDMLITDIKHMDPSVHREYTGVSNETILDNLCRLSKTGKPIIVRIPVIPDINDDMKNMAVTADFIIEGMRNRVQTLQLLAFMRLGEEKYRSFGMSYPMADLELNRESFHQKIERFAEYFNGRGIHCVVGTKENA